MSIAFVCPNGHPLNAPKDLAGKPGKCPKCASKFLIPTLEEAAGTANDAAPTTGEPAPAPEPAPSKSSSKLAAAAAASKRFKDVFVFLCPNGHRLNGPSSLKGKPGKCPHCGAKFLIPSDDEPPPTNAEEEVPTGEVVEGGEESAESYPQYEGAEQQSDPNMAVVEVATTWQLPPPEPAGGHRMAELFTWLWAQREPKCMIELTMKDGQSFSPRLFAPELSQQSYGVFAMRDEMGKFVMTMLSWDNVAKVVVRNLDEIPHALFE